MQHHVECYQNPRQPWSLEREEPQKAQPGVGVSTTPDVNQSRAESRAEKQLAREWRDSEESDGSIEEQPGEVGYTRGGFFKHARVPLNEEYVKE